MEAAFPGYGLLDYVVAIAWALGLIGLVLAKNAMHRNPEFLVRVGFASAVLLIVAPAVLLRRESIWWSALFVFIGCAAAYEIWRVYRKVNK